jgi:hypothetical protein
VSNYTQSSRNPPRAFLWKENPNRLVTLWDIVRYFPLTDFRLMVNNIEAVQHECENIFALRHGGLSLSERMLKDLRADIPRWHDLCKEYGFKDAAVKLWLFSTSLRREGENTHVDISQCRTEMSQIAAALEQALMCEHAYAHIIPERVKYAFQDDLFGPKVFQAFPGAKYDIREAGNCFAVDCNTAAIFHLMRVAEHGLRALARDRGSTVPRGSIEFATWEEILKEVQKAVDAIDQYPKGEVRDAQYEFYHGAMMEFRSFKNVWRNTRMHTRGPSNEDDERREAGRVMQRVGDFMKILAMAISEKKRTPMIWKRAYNKA